MCEEMDSDFDNCLYYTQVRWMSKGRVLKREYSLKLRMTLLFFFKNKI